MMEKEREQKIEELTDEQLENASGGFFGNYASDGAKWVQNKDHCPYFTCKACGAQSNSNILTQHKCTGGAYKFDCCLFCRYGKLGGEILYKCYHPSNRQQ